MQSNPAIGTDPDRDQAFDRIRRADEALNDLERRHGQALFGLARRAGLDDDEADDAVQETLLRLWLEVRSGVDVLDARAWAFQTLYRQAMDQHRLRRRASDLVRRIGIRPAREVDLAGEDRTSVWELVDQLPTRQRQVLYLRHKADMTFEQVAAVMGITSSAARAHSTFALKRLRIAIGTRWAE